MSAQSRHRSIGLLFFKRICDVWDEEYDDTVDEAGDEALAWFPESHRVQIPEDFHWNYVRAVATNVGGALQRTMREIEKANPDTLYGVFGDAQWTNKDPLSDALLKDLIEHFSRLSFGNKNVRSDLIDLAQLDYVNGLLGVYELNRIELFRDVFVRAYERSCQQYVAVHQQLVPPDAMRLRYRNQLPKLVAAIVCANAAAGSKRCLIVVHVRHVVRLRTHELFHANIMPINFRNKPPQTLPDSGYLRLRHFAAKAEIALSLFTG